MKQTAVIYARFSSHGQTEQSIEGQLRECYEYAKRNNLIILHEYIDRALSGTNDKRPEFQQMIEDSKKRDFNYVLVYQLDRFARNRYDSATYKAKLKKNNVRVISAKENITTDASGVLMESVLEGMAEYYSAELSQKVKRGIHESLLKGNYIGGYILYGYDVVNKKYVINETESKIVRQIFDDYANGIKTTQIVENLNNKGLKTKQGLKFSINIISKMLRNTKYMGKCILDNIEYTNIFPAIIDENTFRRCNLIMDEHKHRQRKKEDDDIYILGDISWYNITKTIEIINSLNGRKHLIIGNHEKRFLRASKRVARTAFTREFCPIYRHKADNIQRLGDWQKRASYRHDLCYLSKIHGNIRLASRLRRSTPTNDRRHPTPDRRS